MIAHLHGDAEMGIPHRGLRRDRRHGELPQAAGRHRIAFTAGPADDPPMGLVRAGGRRVGEFQTERLTRPGRTGIGARRGRHRHRAGARLRPARRGRAEARGAQLPAHHGGGDGARRLGHFDIAEFGCGYGRQRRRSHGRGPQRGDFAHAVGRQGHRRQRREARAAGDQSGQSHLKSSDCAHDIPLKVRAIIKRQLIIECKPKRPASAAFRPISR